MHYLIQEQQKGHTRIFFKYIDVPLQYYDVSDKVVVVVPLTHLMNNISTVHTCMNMSNALLLCLFGVGTYKYMYVWIHLMYKFYLILFCSHMTMYKCKTMLCVCVQEVNDIHSHLSRMISRRSSGSQPASQTLVE